MEAAGGVGEGVEGVKEVEAGLVEGAVGGLPEIALAHVSGAEGPLEKGLVGGGCRR